MGEGTEKTSGRSYSVKPVNGGWVARDNATGRVHSAQGVSVHSRASKVTETTVNEAASKRHEALKRLADR